MTSTPRNQPHIPPLQIDLDEILTTLALQGACKIGNSASV